MMPENDRKEIHKAIKEKNFEEFKALYQKWNRKDLPYLPRYATLFKGDVPIGEIYTMKREGFELIDEEECECG